MRIPPVSRSKRRESNTLYEAAAPGIRSRVTDGSEKMGSANRCKCALVENKRWFQGKTRGISEPVRMILKANRFLPLAGVAVECPNPIESRFKVNPDFNFARHHFFSQLFSPAWVAGHVWEVSQRQVTCPFRLWRGRR